MPTSLPPLTDLEGAGTTPDSDTFRAAIGNVRRYLAGLFGATGVPADALTALGGTTVGKALFVAADADAGLTALAGTGTGKAVFQAPDYAALVQINGAGSIASAAANIRAMLGKYYSLQMGSAVVTTNGSGVATITFPEEFLKNTGASQAPSFALVTLGDVTSMSPVAPLASSYTSTTMQIQCAASVTIRVNWLAVAQYRPFPA